MESDTQSLSCFLTPEEDENIRLRNLLERSEQTIVMLQAVNILQAGCLFLLLMLHL